MEIYIEKNGEEIGPFSEDQVRAMLSAGTASPSDMMWYEGEPTWVSLAKLPGLSGVTPPCVSPMRTPLINPQTPAVERPGFLRRLAGFIIDAVIIRGLLYLVNLVFDTVTGALDQTDPQNFPVLVLGSILEISTTWLYYALLESSSKQATVGAMALGFFVTDLENKRISFARATVRCFGMILSVVTFGIGFLMCAFTEKKQCLHDMIAGCLMNKRRSGQTG
jgi:uncharacterized RDD family membrane protein YckC